MPPHDADAPAALHNLAREDMLLFDLHPQPMWVFDCQNLRILLVNDAAITHYGYTREQLLSMTIAQLRPPEDIPRLLQHVGSPSAKEIWRHLRADGSIIDVEISSQLICFERRLAELVIITDVTSHHQTLRRLAQSEDALHSILSSINDIIFVLDLHNRFLNAYTAKPEELAVSPDIFIGQHCRDALPPHICDALELAIDAIARGEQQAAFDYPLPLRGQQTWWNARVSPLRQADQICGHVVVVRDITARKLAENELRDNDHLLELVARHSLAILGADEPEHATMLAFEAIGRALDVDRVYLFHLTPRDEHSEVYASQTIEWTSPYVTSQLDNPDLQKVPMFAAGFGRWVDLLELGEPIQSITSHMTPEERALIEPQDIKAILALPVVIRGQLVGFFGIDDCRRERVWSRRERSVISLISTALAQLIERQRAQAARDALEAQLRHSQKMEAFGHLASGVAHDFNNLLTIINMNLSIMETDDSLHEDHRDTITSISSATQRAANLTRQLLAFSRPRVMRPQPTDLAHVVLSTVQLLRRTLNEDISLETSLAPNLPCALADPDMIGQVLINLAVNARDAMPRGGSLTISLDAATHDDLTSAPSPPSHGALRLTIHDTGAGIAPEHLPRIFEPFFTTKDLAHSAGLGLSMVKGFIEQSHGSIDVSSILGQGTLITIELPIAQHADATPPPPPKLQRDGTTSLNDLHILLVEDNELVQRVTKRLLTRWGAHVTIAHSGDEALPLIASQRFDLIITDMIMPGRASGADVVRFAQHHHPDLPILITTGYASSDLLDEHGLQQTKRLLLLGKPHDASTLEQHLLQLLS